MNKLICLILIFFGYSMDAITISGHRGSPYQAPENTLASFQKAIDAGVTMIELDVHISKTGEIIVIHDTTVDRTTNGSGEVSKKTFEQLRMLHVDNKYKIPTLEEVFELVNRRVKINIELKGNDTAQPVAHLIYYYVQHKGWQFDDFLVSSYELNELKQFKHICPSVPISILCEKLTQQILTIARKIEVSTIMVDDAHVNMHTVESIHQHGMYCFVHTVNSVKRAKKLIAYGVDGIITDYPDVIRAVM